jgi:hypothetical protein
MRDLTSRIPADVRAELDRVAGVLEPAVQAMRDLARLTTTVELGLAVPASLDPAELAPVTEDEFRHATLAVGLDRAMDALGALERAIPAPSLCTD